MKTSDERKTVQWICDQYERGSISFKHKLQRPTKQWNALMHSLLIHSLLAGYPLGEIYVEENDGVIYTIDGTQRVSETIRFVNNEFSLAKSTPSIVLNVMEEGKRVSKEFVLAGKKFDKLDKEVQKALLSSDMDFCFLLDYTDQELKEMFRRKNLSIPLSAKQMRVCYESDELCKVVYELSNNLFMDKIITVAQKKKGSDRDAIRQTFMLLLSDDEHSYTSFRKDDIDAFIIDHGDESTALYDDVLEALVALDDVFVNEDFIKIPVTSVPMILWGAVKVVKNNGDMQAFANAVSKFVQDLASGDESLEEYRKSSKSSTGNQPNVEYRFSWWKKVTEDVIKG